jgi:aspartate aminotransferase
MELSSLLNRFSEPETLKMAKLGRELRAQGIDVIDLSLGEPDFDTPQHIKDAAIKAINDNWSHYTPVAGFLDLREAVCTKLKRDNNLDYTPEQIITSTGAKQSLANALLALVDEGDEVIIPTPYWVTYSELVKIARGKVVEIRTTVEAGFKATPAQIEAAITPKTKVFMFRMYTRFSTMRLPQLAAGGVSVSLKNRQLFSWGVCWSHATYFPEIVPLTVLTTQSGLENVLSD